MSDLEAARAHVKNNNCLIYGCCCCCGSFSLGAIVGLIFLLCSITSLGPEEQVIIYGPEGKYERNGNGKSTTILITPLRKTEFRSATRLGPREYAVLKNLRLGSYRHAPGPTLLFRGAYETIEDIMPKIVLQKHQYMRLVDRMTGYERVVSGPQTLVPEPLETSPNGTETAIVLGTSLAVLVFNKTSGIMRLATGGAFIPAAYETVSEIREATLISPRDFAIVKNEMEGTLRHVEGPELLQVGAYEKIIHVRPKLVLEKDQYIRLLDQATGSERIERGPQTFVPKAAEVYPDGVQRAAYLDTDTAILVLNESSGQERIVTQRGLFIPQPDEEILETRELIRVLPHEAVVVRDDKGSITVYSGSSGESAFFLPPYTEIVVNKWSAYSEPPIDGVAHGLTKVSFTKIDMRMRKMFFRIDARTSDNVELQLDGTIFWRVIDVSTMIGKTSDPEGDVWHHARSAMIQAVSQRTLTTFMSTFSGVALEAFQAQAADIFYSARGVMVSSIELTKFNTTDSTTSDILRQIIQESTERVNRLVKQNAENDVKAAKLKADIALEAQTTEFIQTQAQNLRLEAKMDGEIAGSSVLKTATTFINGLNETVENLTSRVALYKLHETVRGKNIDSMNLATGKAEVFLTPSQVKLYLVGDGSEASSHFGVNARRLADLGNLEEL